jgi:hypothetical protein
MADALLGVSENSYLPSERGSLQKVESSLSFVFGLTLQLLVEQVVVVVVGSRR